MRRSSTRCRRCRQGRRGRRRVRHRRALADSRHSARPAVRLARRNPAPGAAAPRRQEPARSSTAPGRLGNTTDHRPRHTRRHARSLRCSRTRRQLQRPRVTVSTFSQRSPERMDGRGCAHQWIIERYDIGGSNAITRVVLFFRVVTTVWRARGAVARSGPHWRITSRIEPQFSRFRWGAGFSPDERKSSVTIGERASGFPPGLWARSGYAAVLWRCLS